MYQIVIVDDESYTRKLLIQHIAGHAPSFDVIGTFKTGVQAWEFLKNEHADILVTDINMPGMNGLELAEKALLRWPDLVVGVITGYSEFEYARQAINMGVKSFLMKPINLKEFQNALEHMGWQHQMNQQLRKSGESRSDRIEAFIAGLQSGRVENVSEKYRALELPFEEEMLCGCIVTVIIEDKGRMRGYSDADIETAITNVLRMSMTDYRFTAIEQGEGILYLVMSDYAQNLLDMHAVSDLLFSQLGVRARVSCASTYRGLRGLVRLFERQECMPESGEAESLIRRAEAYIAEHYAENITRYTIADFIHLSPVYFGRLFKQTTGESFADYLVRIRMQKAIELLFSSSSVAEISEMVGYASPSSFTRCFRLYTSYSPTDYRRYVMRREDVRESEYET